MILFECNPDKAIIKTLFPNITLKDIEHKHGKGNVLNWIFRVDDSIGLVDRDITSYRSLKYKEMKEIDTNAQYKYSVYEIPNGNFVIELDPELEGWILRVAQLENVDVRKLGFSIDENEFKKEVLIKREKFSKLLDKLLQSNHLIRLKELFNEYYFMA